MTINEHDRVTTGRKGAGDASSTLTGAHALVDLLNAGEPYAVAFGGQGGSWLENLEELISSAGIESELSEIVGEAALLLEPVARELVVVRPIGFEPMQWVRALAADEPLPTTKQLTTAAISGPGILLAQMAAMRAVKRQGLDLQGTPPVAMAGHSQGIIACEALKANGTRDAELLAMAQLIGAAGSLVSRRRGMVGRGDKSPMVSVTNADPDRIAELLEDFSTDVRTVLPPVLSIRNGRRSVVITGTPEQLARFELYCSKITESEEAERKNKTARRRGLQPRVPRCAGRGRLPHAAPRRRRRHRRPLGQPADHRRRAACIASPRPSSPSPSTGSPRSSACTTPARAGSSTSARATPSRASPHR